MKGKTSTGFCKVVPRAQNTLEASPSSLKPTMKWLYKVEPSITSKKKRKRVETTSSLKDPSSIKNRSSTEKDKGKILEPEVVRLGQSDEESNPNEPLHSQEEEDLQKPPKVPMVETLVSRWK